MECSPECLPRDTMVPDVEDVVVELLTVSHFASRDEGSRGGVLCRLYRETFLCCICGILTRTAVGAVARHCGGGGVTRGRV